MFNTSKMISKEKLKSPYETITHGFNCIDPKTSHYVNICASGIKIYIQSTNHDIESIKGKPWYIRKNLLETNKKHYDKLVYETNDYDGFFVGKDFDKHDGGSVLVLLKSKNGVNKYLHVQDEIFTFKTNDKITDYYTNAGNSDVHYSYGIFGDVRYLMIENIIMTIPDDVDEMSDPYDIYYGMKTAADNKSINKKKAAIIKLENHTQSMNRTILSP